MSNVNSLQDWKKKRSEMMGEYVAGRNRASVTPRQTGAGYQQPQTQGMARVAEIAEKNRQAQYRYSQVQSGRQRTEAQQRITNMQSRSGAATQGGTVLTQEQVLANNINDIIGRMNSIMSQPGQMLAPSYSPYYNIFMEQYRQNAEKAKASAYAQAVAGSGGYGSSYATLAGQQAYRDTMEGFTELTPSLVQTKGQAMSDLMEQYQMAKGLQEELGTSETATYRMADGTEVEISEGAREAYTAAVTGELWNGSNAESVKTSLINMGYAADDADIAVKMLQDEAKSGVKDTVKSIVEGAKVAVATPDSVPMTGNEETPGLLYYQNYLKQLRATDQITSDEYLSVTGEISRAVVTKLDKMVENLGSAYSELGYGETEWDELTDAERLENVLNYAGELRKKELIDPEQYYAFFEGEIVDIANGVNKDSDKALADIANVVLALDDYEENKYLTSEEKTSIMKKLRKIAAESTPYKSELENFQYALKYSNASQVNKSGKMTTEDKRNELANRLSLNMYGNPEEREAIKRLFGNEYW